MYNMDFLSSDILYIFMYRENIIILFLSDDYPRNMPFGHGLINWLVTPRLLMSLEQSP